MKKIILVILIVLLIPFVLPRFNTVTAEKIKGVLISNFPEIFETREQPKTTKIIGSTPVYVRHEDLIDIPPLPDNQVLLGSYEGSGKMTYLVGRGTNNAFGVRIVIDDVEVASGNGYNLDILGSDSTGWKLLRPELKDVFEVNNEYPFKEKIEIFLFNHSNSQIVGGAHVELEID